MTACKARSVARARARAAVGVSTSQTKSQCSDTCSPRARAGHEGEPLVLPAGGPCGRVAKREGSRFLVPEERPGKHVDRRSVDGLHDRRRRPALIEHVQRLVDGARPEEPEPRVDREDVEAVMRRRTGCDGVEQVVARTAEPSPEPVVDVTRQIVRLHPVEQLVADPVRLDDARVERVRDFVAAGDQGEVGPGAVEGARELGEARVGRARVAVLEERPRAVGPAEAKRVRRVRVAREEERSAASVTARQPRRTAGEGRERRGPPRGRVPRRECRGG